MQIIVSCFMFCVDKSVDVLFQGVSLCGRFLLILFIYLFILVLSEALSLILSV